MMKKAELILLDKFIYVLVGEDSRVSEKIMKTILEIGGISDLGKLKRKYKEILKNERLFPTEHP